MSRLLALSLLALAAPGAAAEQVHSCHHDNPTCSVGRSLHQHYQDERNRQASNAEPAHSHPCQAQTSPCSVGRPLPQSHLEDYLERLASIEELVHPCQTETPPCSLAGARAFRELDEAPRDLDELIRTTGPGTARPWETPTERYNRTHKPRYHVPYPLSRELLTGAVNPCAGSRPACPWELKEIYDGLERNRDDEDSWHYEYYLNQLGDYYRNHQP